MYKKTKQNTQYIIKLILFERNTFVKGTCKPLKTEPYNNIATYIFHGQEIATDTK